MDHSDIIYIQDICVSSSSQTLSISRLAGEIIDPSKNCSMNNLQDTVNSLPPLKTRFSCIKTFSFTTNDSTQSRAKRSCLGE